MLEKAKLLNKCMCGHSWKLAVNRFEIDEILKEAEVAIETELVSDVDMVVKMHHLRHLLV